MPRISTDNYDTVASWNGSQDLFVVEQPDGTKVATPAMVKQFIEAGDFEATGEVKDGHGNILKDMAKSADVATALAGKQNTLTFDNVPTKNSNNPVKSGGVYSAMAPTAIWEGDATAVGTTYNMTRNYTDFKYLLVSAKTNVEVKNILIPTSSISAANIYSDVLLAGTWNATDKAFTYNSAYGIKFTAANIFKLEGLSYNNANWVLRPRAIYGIG